MILQAIETRYMPATNTKGSRIKAKAAAGSLSIPYPHELNTEDAHRKAALALAERYSWGSDWLQGGSADCRGYVFVQG